MWFLSKQFSVLCYQEKLLSKVFNSVKETNRLKKEINMLLSEVISNMYLKGTIETFSKRRFSGSKKFVTSQIWGAAPHADIIKF